MKSSVCLAVAGAVLATASPLDLFKRKMVTDIVFEYVTITVTAGEQHFGPGKHLHHTSTSTSTSTTVPPPPPPTTTPTPEPEPVPATTEAPVVVESVAPSPSPVAEVTVEAQPSVQVVAASPDPSPVAATTQEAAQAAPTDYASTVVYHHNVHRFNHSAPAVTFSDTHASWAQATAQKCVFEHDLSQGDGKYGQNLALWGSSDAASMSASLLAAQATSNMWYGELSSYASSNYGQDNPDMSNFENFGHFTQLVWKDTQQVGCYTNFCAQGTIYPTMDSWFTVCNYYPAGNVGGGYGANVLPPLGQASVTA
ncbi:PR-1-like protein [Thozetella sp. PMI_491]|nr:PR-1-like protein [Thozetella sp. PMI_491]